jgi:hypothetical protein
MNRGPGNHCHCLEAGDLDDASRQRYAEWLLTLIAEGQARTCQFPKDLDERVIVTVPLHLFWDERTHRVVLLGCKT